MIWRATVGVGTGVVTLVAGLLVVLVGQPVTARWTGREAGSPPSATWWRDGGGWMLARARDPGTSRDP